LFVLSWPPRFLRILRAPLVLGPQAAAHTSPDVNPVLYIVLNVVILYSLVQFKHFTALKLHKMVFSRLAIHFSLSLTLIHLFNVDILYVYLRVKGFKLRNTDSKKDNNDKVNNGHHAIVEQSVYTK